jgi:ferredoxin
MCVATASGVFRHNENRQSTVIDPAGAPAETVLEAASNCPVSAIRVEDADTGQVLFPAPARPVG